MATEAYSAVVTTCPDEPEARRITEILLEQRLCAGVHMYSTNSFYRWQGKLENRTETVLVIKCRSRDYGAIEKQIRAQHSYEVPEIYRLPIAEGSAEYLNWIERSGEEQ